jgi:hypothetical protein
VKELVPANVPVLVTAAPLTVHLVTANARVNVPHLVKFKVPENVKVPVTVPVNTRPPTVLAKVLVKANVKW